MSKAFLQDVIGGIPVVMLKAAQFFWQNRDVRISNEAEAQRYRRDEREAWGVVSSTTPEFLDDELIVRRYPSPTSYGNFSSQDVRYGPGVRNYLRGSQERVVLDGRVDTAYARVEEAARQVIIYQGEFRRYQCQMAEWREQMEDIKRVKQHSYDTECFDNAMLEFEKVRHLLRQGEMELGRLHEWGQLVAQEFRAAVQRSQLAKQQLKNHIEMDGWF